MGSVMSLLIWAYGGQGSADRPCKLSGGLLSGGYTCDDGLVCNEGESTPTCEQPDIHAAGEPCSADDNCRVGLWCDGKACAEPLGEGAACSNRSGCGAGLHCAKGSTGAFCVTVVAGPGDASTE
jgi:hypothetical protein